jgi:hypothetical protein
MSTETKQDNFLGQAIVYTSVLRLIAFKSGLAFTGRHMIGLKINKFYPIIAAAMFLILLSGCDENKVNAKKDHDRTIITSCNTPQKMGSLTLNATDQAQVCNIMVSELKRLPPVFLLRDLLRLVYLVRETAADDSIDSVTLQTMKMVQLRQQQNNDEAIQNTFDVMWKVYQSTQTQIAFDDLDTAMEHAGSAANSVSDSDLERIGIALWQKKIMSEVKPAPQQKFMPSGAQHNPVLSSSLKN